ncbi:3437_t:CDS:2 [Racocetra fulgida]|uniref:3437_t:CDS:1 n=1 Tax=Racocetra fulgida TaxID=60492 RepID=A0A9N8WM04_9GLOM|nr:3437_t:CDS:2 [Racocetra fulgida]
MNADDVATFEMTAPSTIGYAVPEVTEHQSDITLSPSSGVKDGVFTVIFTRPLVVTNSTITSTTQNFVWALHTTSRPSDDPYTMTITRHNDIGHFTITGSISNYDKYIIAHGVLLFLNMTIDCWIHHHLYDPARKYIPWWTRLHCPLVTAYYIWVAIVIIFYLSISFYLWRKRETELRLYKTSNTLYTGIRREDPEQIEAYCLTLLIREQLPIEFPNVKQKQT